MKQLNNSEYHFLKENYNNLFSESIEKIKSTNFQVDEQIDSTSDNRYGITLLIRPSLLVKKQIQKFLDELKQLIPNQYYYRNSDIHITVMSIISCYSGFKLNQINVDDYTKIILNSIQNINKFEINFTGVTASPSAIMIQGFMSDNSLNNIRDNLRNIFKNSNLEQSLDKRYSIQSAHSTVVRFRETVKKKKELIEIIEKYRNYNFGTFTVDKLELVVNDWYQKKRVC